MCLFPYQNTAIHSTAYKKGVTEFKCGACPECLSDKARYWALRCYAEAQYNVGCMVTLTYDDYKYDKYGRKTNEELPVNPELHVSKRHCQLFMKRLRKHFKDCKLSYLICAEYGARTHRAHYHAILFGIKFDDLIFYKRSKRGNAIYKSNTLTKIWGHGIATVDAINVSAQVARYCTKYCAKDTRTDDTFMLFSRGIGDKWLYEHFNGKSYIIDGQEYTIPKRMWINYIEEKYSKNIIFSKYLSGLYRYKSLKFLLEKFGDLGYMLYDFYSRKRKLYSKWLERDKLRVAYLAYWQNKAKQLEVIRPSIFERIRRLPDDKYYSYKQYALKCYFSRLKLKGTRYEEYANDLVTPPRVNTARKARALEKIHSLFGICAYTPCHISANDTIDYYVKRFISEKVPSEWFNVKKEYVQLTI